MHGLGDDCAGDVDFDNQTDVNGFVVVVAAAVACYSDLQGTVKVRAAGIVDVAAAVATVAE